MKKPSRKRPKSVLTKAWETRRAKAVAKQAPEGKTKFISQATLRAADQASPIPHSEVVERMKFLSEITEENMVDQLCSFIADMGMMEHMRTPTDHHPIMVSWPQAKALARFLRLHDIGPFGYNGPLPVDPNVRKAA